VEGLTDADVADDADGHLRLCSRRGPSRVRDSRIRRVVGAGRGPRRVGIIAVVGDQSRCDQCGKIFEVDRTVYHDQTCRRCRAIDDLLHRATLTAERDHRLSRLLNRASLAAIGDAQTWPREEEREELEIRLRPLGPEVELAWRAVLRAAEALKEALSANGSAPARDEAIKLAAERQSEAICVLLDAVRSVRETRRGAG
jgi:phage FluMu protein Com